MLIHDAIIRSGAYPSPLNYGGFPKSICTSINEVVVHGVPDARPLRSGDIINIDVTVYLGGYHGDCSRTFLVGKVGDRAKRLVEVLILVLPQLDTTLLTTHSKGNRTQSD